MQNRPTFYAGLEEELRPRDQLILREVRVVVER